MSKVTEFRTCKYKLENITCLYVLNMQLNNSGIHQQDLLSLNEANKDYLMNGKIHWKKFELIGDCILKVMKFQSASSCSGDIVPESFILSFIREKSFLLTEDVST